MKKFSKSTMTQVRLDGQAKMAYISAVRKALLGAKGSWLRGSEMDDRVRELSPIIDKLCVECGRGKGAGIGLRGFRILHNTMVGRGGMETKLEGNERYFRIA